MDHTDPKWGFNSQEKLLQSKKISKVKVEIVGKVNIDHSDPSDGRLAVWGSWPLRTGTNRGQRRDADGGDGEGAKETTRWGVVVDGGAEGGIRGSWGRRHRRRPPRYIGSDAGG